MPDSARSTDPAVQRQLDRLNLLSPGADILGLERITELLARIGDPHLRLPPVFHVAGTNGKGSTCAFLRAAIEAAGFTAHVYSSPHLVRFNERIRIAGRLIEDAALAALLEEVLDQADGIGASFFEITTAAAFLAFSRTPANACVIEVGLGGRLDATNILPAPSIAGIAQLGIDHQAFLGDTDVAIAGEKAGIAKPGTLLVTMRYPSHIAARVGQVARAGGATPVVEGESWRYTVSGDTLRYTDALGTLVTPLPALAGPHQPANLALAIAMLRFNPVVRLASEHIVAAATGAKWPARMQRLGRGPLTALLPEGSELWLDGGHNPAAGAAVAEAFEQVSPAPRQLVLGMLANKEPEGLIAPFASLVDRVIAVPVPGHEHHAPEALAEVALRLGIPVASIAPDVPAALAVIAGEAGSVGLAPSVLVLGSLYLAGTVLEANDELPD